MPFLTKTSFSISISISTWMSVWSYISIVWVPVITAIFTSLWIQKYFFCHFFSPKSKVIQSVLKHSNLIAFLHIYFAFFHLKFIGSLTQMNATWVSQPKLRKSFHKHWQMKWFRDLMRKNSNEIAFFVSVMLIKLHRFFDHETSESI